MFLVVITFDRDDRNAGVLHHAGGDFVVLGDVSGYAAFWQGQTLVGMNPTDGPNLKKAIMPIVWLKDYKTSDGKTSRILCSTIGAATDLESADLRRLFVNAAYDLTGLKVPAKADVTVVGEYKPLMFGFNKFDKGVKVQDLK